MCHRPTISRTALQARGDTDRTVVEVGDPHPRCRHLEDARIGICEAQDDRTLGLTYWHDDLHIVRSGELGE